MKNKYDTQITDIPISLKKWFPYFLTAGILLNAGCLFTDIQEPDSALYASIAKHIAITHDWVNLVVSGHDWLDKPHLPFWLCAFSFKCFGGSFKRDYNSWRFVFASVRNFYYSRKIFARTSCACHNFDTNNVSLHFASRAGGGGDGSFKHQRDFWNSSFGFDSF